MAGSLNPVTLKFHDQTLEEKFLKHYAEETSRLIRFATAFLIVLAIFISIIAELQLPKYVPDNQTMLIQRMYLYLADIPCMFVIFFIAPTDFFKKNSQWILMSGCIVAAMGVKIAIAGSPTYFTESYAHIMEIMVVMGALIAINLRFLYGLLFVLFELFTYLSAIYFWSDFSEMHIAGHINTLVMVFSVGLFACYQFERFERVTFEQKLIIEAEQEKSENLLLNILPDFITKRLKEDQSAIADRHDEISVLFADIVGFTPMAANLSPVKVVEKLNLIFTEIDNAVEKHGLEKIKTIGDAYMVASGLMSKQGSHAFHMADFALELREIIRSFNTDKQFPLEVRIGIHCGPVVAGVIGKKKFTYDLWGDTVNLASRMESHGEAGTIQISEAFKKQIENKYTTEYKGLADIKGKGELPVWLLTGKI